MAVYPVAIGVIPHFLTLLLSACLIYENKIRQTTVFSLIGVAVSLISGYLLIKRFGYAGGACASLISALAIFALYLRSTLRHIKMNIINLKSLSVSFLILFLFSFLLFLLRGIFLSRIFLFFALVLASASELHGFFKQKTRPSA